MAKKFTSIDDLSSVVWKNWSKLDDFPYEYLNEAGRAAKEAYKVVAWHLAFHDTIESLYIDEAFRDLVSIAGKDTEYYKVLRKINRAIENSLTVENN